MAKRNVARDLENRGGEVEFLGTIPRSKAGAKKVVPTRVVEKAPPSKAVAKTPPVKVAAKASPVKATAKETKPVSRGAVVKETKPLTTRGRAQAYRSDAKIQVIEGVRNYRVPGKVHHAVELMRKHGTVEAYMKAMEASDNDLPALGLLRYLHRKKALNVEE